MNYPMPIALVSLSPPVRFISRESNFRVVCVKFKSIDTGKLKNKSGRGIGKIKMPMLMF